VGIDFLNNHWVLVFKILLNQKTASSRFFLGEKENQNQRAAESGSFKNCKELAVFLKEQVTNQWFYRHT
jgi:hypothetical protein